MQCQSHRASVVHAPKTGGHDGMKNDPLLGSGALWLFLEQSRENAARSYEERISLLESHYVRRLQECSKLSCASVAERQAGAGASGVEICTQHDAGGADRDILTADGDVSLIEIELDESDRDAPSAGNRSDTLETNKIPLLHSTDVSPSPQKKSDLCGMSPEVYTPFLVSTEEKPCSMNVSTYPGRTVANFCSGNENPAGDGDAEMRSEAMINSSMTPTVAEVGGKNTSAPSLCLPRDGPSVVTLQYAPNDAEVEKDVTRCLLRSFGNHLDLAEQQDTPSEVQPPPAAVLEPELQEFLEWKAAKQLRRCEVLQMPPSRVSYLARVYAATQPDLRWSSLLGGNGIPQTTVSVTPDSEPPQFIEWIASGVDCYEDLLLHLTPASDAAERWVVEAVCDVVLGHYLAECVLDCILNARR